MMIEDRIMASAVNETYTLKCFMIVGEESGDLLGSKIMAAVRQEIQVLQQGGLRINVEFRGVGGQRMQEQGFLSLIPLEKITAMGLIEVLPKLMTFWQAINYLTDSIDAYQPDMVITVDSPDLAFRIMKKVKRLPRQSHMYKAHVVAPSVWAYRPERAEQIAKLYDVLFTLLPFEPPYFEKYGLETLFVGHPLIADAGQASRIRTIENAKLRQQRAKDCQQRYNLPDTGDKNTKLICVTPGSRPSEVKCLLPIFRQALQLVQQQHAIRTALLVTQNLIALVKHLWPEEDSYALVSDETDKASLRSMADVALAKSGTNTFEFMLNQVPMVVAYRFHPATAFIAQHFLHLKPNQFANLANIILQHEAIPECIQENCTPQRISEELLSLINSPMKGQRQVQECQKVLYDLGYNTEILPTEKIAKKLMLHLIENYYK